MLLVEFSFLMDFMLTFITTIEDKNDYGKETRDFTLIYQAYMEGNLKYDLIALIPFNLLSLKNDR
jgi:hypothetical protein